MINHKSLAVSQCKRYFCLAMYALLSVLVSAAFSQDSAETTTVTKTVKTEHVIRINGTPLQYQAQAGKIDIKNDKDKHVASIFYCAYLKEHDQQMSGRPITFIFNGGPGSSAIWVSRSLLT